MRFATVCLLAAFTSFATSDSFAAEKLPNIIHIVGDDVGYDDLSCFSARDIKTPHLDRLAREGIKFTSFYAPSPTCTPTRAALMTGCYAQRVGLPNVLFPKDQIGLHESEKTIGELLQEHGYATAVVGKWHLGHHPKFLPPNHGFDLYFGIPYPNDHGPERLNAQKESRGFPPMPLIRGTNIVEQPAQLASLPERFTAEAIQFITANTNRPFFLHLSNIETHTPWLVPARFHYHSAAGVYGDAVQCLDWTVGQVLDAVDRLGLRDNTLIVFSSDNGPLVHRSPELEGIYGHAGAVRTNRSHLLREGKYQARYEGGVRVACLMRWPGKIKAGSVCSEIAAGFDLFTTFAKVAGARLPTDRRLDGKDIRPLMFSEPGAKSPHEAFYYYQAYRLFAVRSGPWKLVLGGPAGAANANRAANQREELYNLDQDISEKNNILEQHPEVAEKLRVLAAKAREDIGDAARNTPGRNRRPAGQL